MKRGSMAMRTRFLSKCTNDEVEAYLDRSDVLFVASGVTELHGGLPLDAESVLSEAMALRLAEQVDGLVLHNLPYLYAGATASGRGTTQLSVRSSIDYLYALAESLLRQGFRRIVWTSLHGPAGLFISPVIRDIFDSHKVPMLYVDGLQALFRGDVAAAFAQIGGDDPFGDLTVGAYDILGRLDDVPLTTPETEYWAEQRTPSAAFADDLVGAAAGSGAVAYYFNELTDHMRTQSLRTDSDRAAAAARGRQAFEQLLARIPIAKMLDDLRRLDRYNHETMDRYPSTRPHRSGYRS
ncbi:MAG: creatininase family protein, partial [Pseudonocardia sp.]|nr:creatininase family protein [Pseudonocardia sp.]